MANKTISIGFRLDDQGKGLKTLTVEADKLRDAIFGAVDEANFLKKTLEEAGKESFGFDAIKNSLADITALCDDLSAAYQVQIEVETKLETVMRERMDATDAMIQGIKDLTSAQQELGIIGKVIQGQVSALKNKHQPFRKMEGLEK